MKECPMSATRCLLSYLDDRDMQSASSQALGRRGKTEGRQTMLKKGLYDVMLRDSRGGQFKGLGQPIVLRVRACIVTVSGKCRYSLRLVKVHCHPFPHTLTPLLLKRFTTLPA